MGKKSIRVVKEDRYCACGCGLVTSRRPHSDLKKGLLIGDPNAFIWGHNPRMKVRGTVFNPSKGCSEHTQVGRYGRVRDKGKLRPFHVVVYEKHVGKPVPVGLVVDHLCGNNRCVTPEHLEAVTPVENMRRGRSTKLTRRIVIEIRNQYKEHITTRRALGFNRAAPGWQIAMGKKFGVAKDTIKHITRRTTWADIAETKENVRSAS